MDGGVTTTLLYKNKPLTLYSQKDLKLQQCERRTEKDYDCYIDR